MHRKSVVETSKKVLESVISFVRIKGDDAEEYVHSASARSYSNISHTSIDREKNHKDDNEKRRNSSIINAEKGHTVDAIMHSPIVNIATKTSEKTPLVTNARKRKAMSTISSTTAPDASQYHDHMARGIPAAILHAAPSYVDRSIVSQLLFTMLKEKTNNKQMNDSENPSLKCCGEYGERNQRNLFGRYKDENDMYEAAGTEQTKTYEKQEKYYDQAQPAVVVIKGQGVGSGIRQISSASIIHQIYLQCVEMDRSHNSGSQQRCDITSVNVTPTGIGHNPKLCGISIEKILSWAQGTARFSSIIVIFHDFEEVSSSLNDVFSVLSELHERGLPISTILIFPSGLSLPDFYGSSMTAFRFENFYITDQSVIFDDFLIRLFEHDFPVHFCGKVTDW
eukprot:CAMPEP_0194284048 /NCGR_PEP_ID=MMETSP0169-20130528/26600_1 /TAXON_ID=218684 /ORGANISM="Corethron pennatum, Strain L29A3" /LENGTH=393 /DNA_ID=CAMNT_0039029771 /DNA_START=351 /DNA_END=1529 /DNA_ORIENTATION=+